MAKAHDMTDDMMLTAEAAEGLSLLYDTVADLPLKRQWLPSPGATWSTFYYQPLIREGPVSFLRVYGGEYEVSFGAMLIGRYCHAGDALEALTDAARVVIAMREQERP